MTFAKHLMALAGGFALAGCASDAPPEVSYLLRCQQEIGAKGTYTQSSNRLASNGLPQIVPAAGGDLRGAVLLNACVERRHIAAGTMPKARVKTSAPVMVKGKMALPQGYNLTADDRALWPTLTLAQQKRALAFLKSDSTIQSSLLKD